MTVDRPRACLRVVLHRWPPIPEAPALYTIGNPGGDGSYTMRWSAVSGAISYVFDEAARAKAPTAADFFTVHAGASTEYTISGKGVERYQYLIKARNSWGDSTWSNVGSVDVFWQAEPNGHEEDVSQANGPLVSGKVYGGYPDDEDDYYFDLFSSATVNVLGEDFAPTSDIGMVMLHGPVVKEGRGKQIDYYGEPDNSSISLGPHSLGPGKYYVRVYIADNHSRTEEYQLQATSLSRRWGLSLDPTLVTDARLARWHGRAYTGTGRNPMRLHSALSEGFGYATTRN